MSKISEKKKIEEIAKNLLRKQKSYKNINTMTVMNKQHIDNLYYNIINDKNNNICEETMKDSMHFSKRRNQKNITNKEIKKARNESLFNQYTKNGQQNKSNDNLKFYSTVNNSLTDYYYCCKKNIEHQKSLIDDENIKNDINNINDVINNNIQNNINNNIIENNKQEKKIQNKINEEYKNIEPNNISSDNSSIIDENNLDTFNKIVIIYKELKNDFSNSIKRQKNNHFKSQILACDYFKFLFSDNIYLFIKFFNYSIDVNKFIFYQIYLFLTLIYIDENKDLNECSEMAYRTILLYSFQNYELLLNLIKKVINPNEPKVYKSLMSKNKIIISVLKTLYPKKISDSDNNEQFFMNNDYLLSFNILEEIETETKKIKSNEIKKKIYNKLIKIISILKNNERLNNKINQIERQNEIENMIKNNNIRNNNDNISSNQNYNILPEFDSKKYKYSIFIDLDETIVHYYEKDNNYFVKVRIGADDFIKSMSEFCEIIIVSLSNKEYTDIIIKNLNKDSQCVNYTIYKESFDEDNEQLDLSLINRDIKKCIFICHTDDFFNVPKGNIVKLSEFLGEENDNEIIYLHNELMKLSKKNVSDVKEILKGIKINENSNNI